MVEEMHPVHVQLSVPGTDIPPPTGSATVENDGRVSYQDPVAATALHAEITLPPGVVEVHICGETVRIIPVNDWFTEANEALRDGRMNKWAELSLYCDEDTVDGDNDYEDVWLQLNDGRGPRNSDVEEMFLEWGKLTGQGNPGKSRRSRRS